MEAGPANQGIVVYFLTTKAISVIDVTQQRESANMQGFASS
jgi:hypothetical protein